jgi:general secretion pathway protein M
MSEPANKATQAALADLKTRWQALAPRERQLVQLVAWLLGITLLFLVGIRPAWRTLQTTPAQIAQTDAVVTDMRHQADEVRRLRQSPKVPSSQAEAALVVATQALGDAAKLRLQGEQATVTLTQAPGPALSTWLQEVRTNARARPTQANLIQVVPGFYSGSVMLTLSAAPAAR